MNMKGMLRPEEKRQTLYEMVLLIWCAISLFNTSKIKIKIKDKDFFGHTEICFLFIEKGNNSTS